MKNLEIAKILYGIADILEMQDVEFKPFAYRKAAQSIESMPEDIEKAYKEGRLESIPGVGKHIAEKIEEILETGHLKYYDKLKKKFPISIDELSSLPGLGPKKIILLYKKLKIKNLKDLEKAAKKEKIRKLAGFGKKTEENILDSIGFIKGKFERTPIGFVLPAAREIEDEIKSLPYVRKAMIAGSLRRMKETVRDIDILVLPKNENDIPKIMDYFCSMDGVEKVIGKGRKKSFIRLENGIDADLVAVPEKSWGSGMQYFTGSKQHSIELRRIAIKKGLKLNEYGVFKRKTEKQVAGKTEKEVYNALGLQYIEPELREMNGEIEIAAKKKLPKLIGYNDLKGDLQCHSEWSDGNYSIKEMAIAAKKKGMQYLGITDHTKSLAIAQGLDEKKLTKYIKEIDKVNKEVSGIHVLKGAEVNIMKDGSLDLENKHLKKLDYVLIALHSNFKMEEKEMTNRVLKAMENPYVKILGHPTGRKINRRKPIEVNMEKVIDKAKELGIYLEIDSTPNRLDLNEDHVRQAIKNKNKLIIDSDSHNISHFDYLELGIGIARRGWAGKKDVINTLEKKRFLKEFL